MKKDTIKNIILEYLYEQRDYASQFFYGMGVPEDVIEFAQQKGTQLDSRGHEKIFRETFWDLASKGLVVQGTSVPGGTDKLPWVSITDYGIKCFEEGKILPYDPNEFLNSLYRDAPHIDAITRLYMEEAVSCFSNMNYLASVVMVGGALERDIVNITTVFHERIKDKNTQNNFELKVIKQNKIKTKFDRLLQFLKDEGYSKNLSLADQERLNSLFPAIVNLIRISRNETGHPTGREVSHDEAEAYLLLAKEALKFGKTVTDLV